METVTYVIAILIAVWAFWHTGRDIKNTPPGGEKNDTRKR